MISFYENDKRFNFRVGCFIYDKSFKYLLIHKKRDNDFWMLPGGRVELFESTDEAISREIYEELGITVNNPRLVLINEIFYVHNGLKNHELSFDFEFVLDRCITKEQEFSGIEGDFMVFKWIDVNNVCMYKFFNDNEKDYILNNTCLDVTYTDKVIKKKIIGR